MKNSKKIVPIIICIAFFVIFAIIALSFFFVKPGREKVVDDDYSVTKYVVSAIVNEDNSYSVTETITADFDIYKHGIYRYLPVYQSTKVEYNGKKYSENYKIKYTNINCSENIENTYNSDGFFVIQIGDDNIKIIGRKTYTLSYKLVIGDDKIKQFDQFYYNLIGTGWDTTVSDITVNVSFSKPVTQTKAYLYVGEYGEKNEVELDIINNAFSYSYGGTLKAFTGITARVVLDEGYFVTQKAGVGFDIFILAATFVFLAAVALWMIKKNNNKPIIPVVEFTAPDGMTPADAGYIIDRIVNKKDVASLIVYWANKGFIKIKDKSDDDCELTKLKDADKTFKKYEKELFNALFKDKQTINLGDTNEKVAVAVNGAIRSIANENKSENFSAYRTGMRILYVVLTGILLYATYVYLGHRLALYNLAVVYSIGFSIMVLLGIFGLITAKELKYSISKTSYFLLAIISTLAVLGSFVFVGVISFDMYSNPLMISIFVPLMLAVVIFMLTKINVRTEKGGRLLGSLIGLKEFIMVAEKDRIKMLVKDDPSVFYEILPYAYVLGVSDIWINKFENLIVQAPDWYEGRNDNVFFGYYLIATMNHTNSFYTRSIAQFNSSKAGSGRGGFGGGVGGGFSGGGFGGGGGGSW